MRDSGRSGPTFVFLFGPPAVGKMTVGQELARLTGFTLFHIHQVTDLLTPYFPHGSPSFGRLLTAYRQQFFEEAAASGLDVITTDGWRFDLPDESAIIGAYTRPSLDRGGRVCFVELAARLETRLERNLTENRRRHKNTDWSTPEALRRDDAAHRHDSGGAIPLDVPFLRIETDGITVDQTARRIAAHFGLPR